MDYQIVSVLKTEKDRVQITLDNGDIFTLYKGEAYRLSLSEHGVLSSEQYQQILNDIIGKRAVKYAMHLLERQERTEKQLRDKLNQQGYPKVCVEQAMDYVKSYHYIDDLRYARVYIRYHQEKESRQKLITRLWTRGIRQEIIEQALEEEFAADEQVQIEALLKKRRYNPMEADEAVKRKTVQFLMRRGFQTQDIFRVMRDFESF